jgi:hypothetical protein
MVQAQSGVKPPHSKERYAREKIPRLAISGHYLVASIAFSGR